MGKFIIPGLFMTSLITWGPGLFFGQTYSFIIIALVMGGLMMKQTMLSCLIIYMAMWVSLLLSSGLNGIIPVEIVGQGIDMILNVFAGVGIYIFVRQSGEKEDKIFNGICTLSLVLLVIAIVGLFINHEFTGPLGNRNFLGAFLALSLPFFFRSGWRKFIPAIIAGLWLSHTASAIGAALIGTGFFMWGWKGAGIGTLFGTVYFLLFKIASLGSMVRLSYWSDALHKISNSWHTLIFGVGPGVYWQYDNDLHSEPLNIIWSLGLVGMVIIGTYVFKALKYAGQTTGNSRLLHSAFLIVAINSFGNHVMHTAPTAMLAIIIFALRDREVRA